MSYRNPQIIVDRSAEIYAQGAAKTGALFAQGIAGYFDYKNKQKEKVDKEKKIYQIGFNKTEEKFDSSLNDVTSKIKQKSLFKKIQDQGRAKLDGKENDMGVISMQAQINYNPDLDKETKSKYKEKISDYEFWENRVVDVSGTTAADLDVVKQTNGSEYGTSGSIEFLGEGNDKFATMIATQTLLSEQVPGAEVSDATEGDVLGYNITLDTNNDYIKEAMSSGALEIKPEDIDENGKFKLKWNRNINNWDGSLIVDIPKEADITSYLTNGKVLKDNEISSSFITNTEYNIDPIAKTGYQRVTPKNYFDPYLITKNASIQGEFLKYAKGQLSQPIQITLSGLRNNYGENVSIEKWSSMSPEAQANFIIDELNEKAIQNITDTTDIKTDLFDKTTGKVVDPSKIKSLAKKAGVTESQYQKDFLDVKYYTLGKSFDRKAPGTDEPTDAELRARRKEAKTTAEQKKKIEYLDKAYSIDRLRNLDQVKSIAKKEALKIEEFENSEDIEIGGKTISPGMSPGEIRKILLIASGIDAATADEMAGEDLAPFGPNPLLNN
jgi:hypothetical protein